MFQSLLVPLDGSSFSERTLRLAKNLAEPNGAALHLAQVHVTDSPDALLSNPQFHFEGLDMAEYEAQDRANEEAYLRDVQARIGDGIPVDSMLLEGPVAKEIATYATRVGADLVLITTHGRSGAKRVWLGSVADALLHCTHLPLLVLHPPPGGEIPIDAVTFGRIFVPLDGSERSASILDAAVDLAEASGASIILAHVVAGSSGFAGALFPMRPHELSAALEKADAYLEYEAQNLRERGLDVTIAVESYDNAIEGISKMAETLGADVIAIATHGYGGLRRVMAGSVADGILHSSPLPLLVQRPAD